MIKLAAFVSDGQSEKQLYMITDKVKAAEYLDSLNE